MNWTGLLKAEIEDAYHATEGLLKLVDRDSLGWKPATGSNWMTVGQLLEHLTTACGAGMKGFVTGDWGMPEESVAGMPTAETMPAAKSVAAVKRKLAADKALALEMVEKAGERSLGNRATPAPWDPRPMVLGQRMMQMVAHLAQHKAQLFYYLKLQGKPVHTGHLWGM